MAGMKLRFSIRDLLWLIFLAAILVAWWLDHRRFQQVEIVTHDDGSRWVMIHGPGGGISSMRLSDDK
jgi:hypothetical protein